MQKKAITNKPPLNPSIHFSECKLNAQDCPCVCSVSLQPPFISPRQKINNKTDSFVSFGIFVSPSQSKRVLCHHSSLSGLVQSAVCLNDCFPHFFSSQLIHIPCIDCILLMVPESIFQRRGVFNFSHRNVTFFVPVHQNRNYKKKHLLHSINSGLCKTFS